MMRAKPAQLRSEDYVASPLPLALSVFDFPSATDEPRQVNRRKLSPIDEDFPLATVPAPVVPELSWDIDEPRIVPRRQRQPVPDALVLVESLFEDPPAAPDLSWEIDDLPRVQPRRAVRTEDAETIDSTLYGTIDLHPGYWFTDELPLPRQRRKLRPIEPTDITTAAVFTDYAPTHDISEDFTVRRPNRARRRNHAALEDSSPGYTRIFADSARLYFTGAASDGAAQASQASSLGDYRSSTEAERVGIIQRSTIQGLTLDWASRANGDSGQVGTLFAVDSNRVSYAAPDGVAGEPVRLISGQTAIIADGGDPSKYVRVTRTSTADLIGVSTIEYSDQYNNVFSLSDAGNTESTSGGSRYRAVMVRCHSLASLRGVKFYVGQLGTVTTASGGGLPTSGAGTIGAPAGALADWPYQGWVRIVNSGGTLREVAYYSSRTDTQLTVPALGRGRLGTTASLGAADDAIYPVPGIRIAWEDASPADSGNVQTIADESTAPTGLTWSTAITAANGVTAGDGVLHTREQGALWIHRELPAGVSAFSQCETKVHMAYTVEGVEYTETLAGRHRIAVNATRRLELRIGVGQLPDPEATPDETEVVAVGTTPEAHLTATPWTTTAELTDDAVNYISVNFRNEYGLASESLLTHTITLSGGSVVENPPSAPEIQTLAAAASGAFRLTAVYFYEQDTADQRADQWLVYLTTDGSTPDPSVHTPTVVSLVAAGDGAAFLDWTSGTFANGTTGKALVRVRRSADTSDSSSSDVLTATASTAGPSAITGGLFYRKQAEG